VSGITVIDYLLLVLTGAFAMVGVVFALRMAPARVTACGVLGAIVAWLLYTAVVHHGP
jgi:hypothetical protein